MERIINIGGTPVPMKATASTLIRYRNQYGRDLLEDFQTIQSATKAPVLAAEAIQLFICLCHTMAKQADPTIVPDAFDWVDQFDIFPIRDFYLDVVSLWAESLGQTVEVAEEKNA